MKPQIKTGYAADDSMRSFRRPSCIFDTDIQIAGEIRDVTQMVLDDIVRNPFGISAIVKPVPQSDVTIGSNALFVIDGLQGIRGAANRFQQTGSIEAKLWGPFLCSDKDTCEVIFMKPGLFADYPFTSAKVPLKLEPEERKRQLEKSLYRAFSRPHVPA